MKLLLILALFGVTSVMSKTVDEFAQFNHCTTAADCVATKMSNAFCPSSCGRMGILMHKGETAALAKLKAAAANRGQCPQVDCPAGTPVNPNQCSFRCVKAKCWLDMSKSAKGC